MTSDVRSVTPDFTNKGTDPSKLSQGRSGARNASDASGSVRVGRPDGRPSFQDAFEGASRSIAPEPVPQLSEARRTVYDGVGTTPEEKEASLRWAAKQLESFLVNELFKVMRSTVKDGGLVQKSRGEKIYQQMLDQEMARSISESSPLGIADLIVHQLEDQI